MGDAYKGSAGIRRRQSSIRKHSKECHSICLKTLNKTGKNEADNLHNKHVCYVDLKECGASDVHAKSSRMRPATLCFENEKIKTEVVLECIPSPLTPREQFFFDMFSAANQFVINATIIFIERETYNCEKERMSYSNKIDKELSEYFVASIPENCCRSEAFIFVESV